jgi:hypothetical protein
MQLIFVGIILLFFLKKKQKRKRKKCGLFIQKILFFKQLRGFYIRIVTLQIKNRQSIRDIKDWYQTGEHPFTHTHTANKKLEREIGHEPCITQTLVMRMYRDNRAYSLYQSEDQQDNNSCSRSSLPRIAKIVSPQGS